MKRKFIVLVAAVMACVTLFSFSTSAASKWLADEKLPSMGEYDYSFVFIGDTQILTMLDAGNTNKEEGSLPSEWKNQNYMNTLYQWIVDNKEEKKIEYVVGLGDITENISRDNEWAIANKAITKLNGVVPYSMARGNHDGGAKFKEYIVDKNPGYTDQFVDTFGFEKLNTAATLSVAGVDYLFVTINCDPTDNELKWAGDTIAKYPNHRVILSTHYYLSNSGKIATDVSSLKGPNCGQDIWDKLVSKHENIFMVVCGHVGVDTIIQSKLKRESGSIVYQFLINPQGLDFSEAPTGLVAIFYFNETNATFSMEYYSTVQDKYRSLAPYRVRFGEPKATEAPETTLAPSDEGEETVDTTGNSGCGNVIGYASMPLVIGSGITAFTVSKKRKK